jgi:hypothetical protein
MSSTRGLFLAVAKIGLSAWSAAAAVAALIGASAPVTPRGADVYQIKPGTSLSAVQVTAGGTYELAAGGQYTGTLDVDADDVTVQSYGSGRWPVLTRHSYGSDIEISGRGDTVRWLRITAQGYDGKNGYIVGVGVSGAQATITDVSVYGELYAGVYFERPAADGTLSHSVIDHCDGLNPRHLSSGAFGVLLWGTRNTVEDNTIENQSTASPVYGTDGSAVEVYHGRDNIIRDNTGSNDTAFTELGGAGAAGNAYIGNTFTGPGDFLITRGSGDTANGPVLGTVVTGNQADGEVVSYGWRPSDGTLLTLTGNTIAVPGKTALWTDGGYVNGGDNVFTGKVIRHHS